jgi:hypothetical protein
VSQQVWHDKDPTLLKGFEHTPKFRLRAHGRYDRSAEDAYSSAAPNPTVAFVGGPCCPTLDFVVAFWIMIAFYTLTSLFSTINTLRQQTTINFVTPRESEKWKDGETIQSLQELENNSHLFWYTYISYSYRDIIAHITLTLLSTLHSIE